jgi:SAGA-associated factor 29
MAENQKQRINDELRTRIELLRDTQRIKEKEQEKANDEGSITGRASSSRTSGMEFDGPSDSPVPSPAENRQVRKIGASRTSSQPPRGLGDKDNTPSEASERASKPKVVYHQGQEVAFKRKVPNGKTEEQDWIQGRVVRVIGEGKSRRYEVKDPYPDENSGGPNVYKSSASQMVPIPPEGATLGDYEPGRMVLALYPETTTFYRAEVKAMLDGGKKVQLLFEGETDAQLNEQDRRFVLDHKG